MSARRRESFFADDYFWDWPDDDFFWEEPPLYAFGKLAGMTLDELEAEVDRQIRIHDMAVDRCEEVNSPTIETAAARARMCEDEIMRRKPGS